ncbi:hypothetical protein BD310DRAFT_811616 [Dichomitus squalens]|uniref:Uncharacterized protein n=1 Tax=Dichomitus squalens TaxID=114155 RepID=A0A4Q9Q5X7_9APHY|nr:hypothetical protein BD310DRAFT_811616 [Dichomitus squalens]
MWPVNTAQYESGCSELPLYAPMPLNGPAYPRLLSNIEDDASNTSGTTSFASHESDAAIPEAKPYAATDEENPLDVYLDAPQILFPTPSELLSDLNTRSESGGGAAQIDAQEKSRSTSMSSSSGPSLAKRKRESREKPENLNQRKAYFRAVSENVGFTITDPDTITSHDKKRSYLECLEEYVQWLHEQIRLVGHEPVPLERISTYRGLRNNSLRTMLVHMQTTIRDRNVQKQRAEERFLELESALMMRTAAEESLQFRRHSIAIGAAIPSSIAPGFMG